MLREGLESHQKFLGFLFATSSITSRFLQHSALSSAKIGICISGRCVEGKASEAILTETFERCCHVKRKAKTRKGSCKEIRLADVVRQTVK